MQVEMPTQKAFTAGETVVSDTGYMLVEMPTQKAFTAGSEFPPLENGKLRLYSMRFCPFAQRTRILLAQKNIEYETVNINLQSKPEWFLKNINPLGLVPAIQHNDTIVYDSKICNEYLDEAFPGDKLIPSDPYLRAKDKMLLEHYSKLTEAFYKTVRTREWKEGATNLKKGLAIFEEELRKRNTPYFGGEKPMNIDFCIWPHLERVEAMKMLTSEFAITEEEFPRMHKWIRLITEVPAVKETLFSAETHLKLWEMRKNGVTDYDYGLEE